MAATDPLLSSIRGKRRAMGITQVALASQAGVSLATLQNMEAGTANPSLRVLRRVLGSLGLDLVVRPRAVDWDTLVGLGLPLMAEQAGPGPSDPSALPGLMREARLALKAGEAPEGMERYEEALDALYLALRSHFPSAYRSWFAESSAIGVLARSEPTGRVIKLARIARERLAQIL